MKTTKILGGVITFKILVGAATFTFLSLSYGADGALVPHMKNNGDQGFNLHVAAATGEIEKVRSLLNAGTPPDARDARGEGNALLSAALQSQVAVAQLLLSRGAQTGRKDAFIAAITNGHLNFIRFLVQQCPEVIDEEIIQCAKDYVSPREPHTGDIFTLLSENRRP